MLRDQELYLARNGTIVMKFMLNVSKEMQARRFLRRIEDPSRQWKFSAADMVERQHWEQYQLAYSEAISATAKPWAPWYVIPADSKPFMKKAVSDIIAQTLEKLDLQPPQISERQQLRFDRARTDLEAEFQAKGQIMPQYSARTRLRDLERDLSVREEESSEARATIEEMRHLNWKQLSKSQKAAARVLGFSAKLWNPVQASKQQQAGEMEAGLLCDTVESEEEEEEEAAVERNA